MYGIVLYHRGVCAREDSAAAAVVYQIALYCVVRAVGADVYPLIGIVDYGVVGYLVAPGAAGKHNPGMLRIQPVVVDERAVRPA